MRTELRCYQCGEPDTKCTCGQNPDDRVLPQHAKWMTTKLTQLTAGCDYVNNIRIALDADMDAVHQYAIQYAKGCCGEVDAFVRHADGTVYLVGFNHGH